MDIYNKFRDSYKRCHQAFTKFQVRRCCSAQCPDRMRINYTRDVVASHITGRTWRWYDAKIRRYPLQYSWKTDLFPTSRNGKSVCENCKVGCNYPCRIMRSSWVNCTHLKKRQFCPCEKELWRRPCCYCSYPFSPLGWESERTAFGVMGTLVWAVIPGFRTSTAKPGTGETITLPAITVDWELNAPRGNCQEGWSVSRT